MLAPVFARLFFPPGHETAALLGTVALYAAGFVVRPFGALFFGPMGDRAGRTYAFLVSSVFMGFSTFTIGLLPVFSQAGWLAPALLLLLRVLQGLALGGVYGGVAATVAEYFPANRHGFATSFVQTTATSGLLLALIAVAACRTELSPSDFERWGWRIPFLVSILFMALSISIRAGLRETPVFLRMRAERRLSERPLVESFFRWPNNKYAVLALFGATAGQAALWYTAHLYTLVFLTVTLRLDDLTSALLVAAAMALGMPFFIFFGWLSDKIGRLKIVVAGCLLAVASYFPLFQSLAGAVNPALIQFQAANPVTLRADRATCTIPLFAGSWQDFSLCNRVADFLTGSGLRFMVQNTPGSQSVEVSIGTETIKISAAEKESVAALLERALFAAGYPGLSLKQTSGGPQVDARGAFVFERKTADPALIDVPAALGVLLALMLIATMAYGPIAALLVELFAANVRCTSLSLPYHIGNGVFGGLLPLIATATVAATGNPYAGLVYPVSVAAITAVIGGLCFRRRPIHEP